MQSGGGERLVQVPREWAAEALAPRFREAPETERLGRARQFLEEEELDSGIVVRRVPTSASGTSRFRST